MPDYRKIVKAARYRRDPRTGETRRLDLMLDCDRAYLRCLCKRAARLAGVRLPIFD